jgi:hypothetical protein
VDENGHSADSTQQGDQSHLPIHKAAPPDAAVSAADSIVAAPAQQKVTVELLDEPRADEGTPDPLRVRVVKDDDLSSFESKTIKYAKWGVLIAGLSLAAAIAAAIVFYFQFKEMSKQTGILAESLTKQKEDSAAAAITTGQQLKLLQSQLTQQRNALEMDQRPWLKFELGGERPKDVDPNDGKTRLLTTTAGQPIKIEVRVTNIGKTTAERILGTLTVQYVPKGGKPILPRNKNRIVFVEGGKPEKGTIPSTAWGEATLYPNEVSQNSFSRSRWRKNGIVEDDPITQAEKTALDNGNAYVLLLGQIWYSDVFGVRHWTKFCAMSMPQLDPLAAKKCVAFGAVDASEPKSAGQHPKAN